MELKWSKKDLTIVIKLFFLLLNAETLSGEDCDVGIVAGGGAAFASIDRV
jgi:hypothetical protein